MITMASGGSTKVPGYAYFSVVYNASEQIAANANLDMFHSIFERTLGFTQANKNLLENNLSRNQWNHKMQARQDQNRNSAGGQCCILCHIKTLDLSNMEYLMIGITSHGGQKFGQDFIQLADLTYLHVNDMMADLNDKNFPALQGKKRILVIDCCRTDVDKADGASEDYGKDIQTIVEYDTSDSTFGGSTVPYEGKPPVNVKPLSPYHRPSSTYIETQPKDFLVIYSTTPGRYGYENKAEGSWMLQSLNKAISEHNIDRPLNLLHALTRAAQIMSDKESVSTHGTMGEKSILYSSSTLQSLPIFNRQVQQPLPPTAPMDQDLPQNAPLF